MALWVTFKNGEVRKYNECTFYDFLDDWVTLRTKAGDKDNGYSLAKLRSSEISKLEFSKPCEVTFQPNVFESAVNVIMKRAPAIRDEAKLNKLADLARFLRKFNPQRKRWK